ncbi:hypothetical protein [Neobacillus drentensis]|uniref:hypothetical protein n=1 Tax=Neobacillus drentensis TaxID=220684 RepID=UPI002FFEA820
MKINIRVPYILSHESWRLLGRQIYWAPECYYYMGSFFLVAPFRSAFQNVGTQILIADSPTGPFRPHSYGPVTPKDWNCLGWYPVF